MTMHAGIVLTGVAFVKKSFFIDKCPFLIFFSITNLSRIHAFL